LLVQTEGEHARHAGDAEDGGDARPAGLKFEVPSHRVLATKAVAQAYAEDVLRTDCVESGMYFVNGFNTFRPSLPDALNRSNGSPKGPRAVPA
jgi:hypothetical protein